MMRDYMLMGSRPSITSMACCALAATSLLWSGAARAADAAKPPRPSARVEGLSDEQVVNAMHRGIDYLLQSRAGDNWESGNNWPFAGQKGGETALVLYALLNAGASLGDDPYADKLNFRAPEIVAATNWLCQVEPKETYTAGLMASALALLPKHADDKSNVEGPRATMERCKFYLLTHMGAYGGYTYGFPGAAGDMPDFMTAFEAYVAAKVADTSRGNINVAANDPLRHAYNDARGRLDNLARGLENTAGGPDVVIQQTQMDLNAKGLKAKKAGDAAAAQRAAVELQELQRYSREMPRNGTINIALQMANARRAYETAQRAMATGNLSEIPDKAPNTPRTRADMPDYLAECKQNLDTANYQGQNQFVPIGDLSNAQYGTLGAWALSDFGIELPLKYWQIQDRFWRLLHRADGGWAYSATRSGPPDQLVSKGTMTAAAVASLYVANEFSDLDVRQVPREDKILDEGVEWLASKFEPHSGDLYYMYGVERVGLASGLKFLHTTNWYKEGAANIVARQGGDGSWNSHGSNHVGTAYALLFLARGRNPVVFNKLQHEGYWNTRPRDDANLTHWMSKMFEKPINWQVVNLQVKPEEWLDAPVLLITGSKDPKFTTADVDKLRAYVNAGGIIFSSADNQSREFTEAMKKYAVQLTGKKYEMRELPRTHALFTRELWSETKMPPKLLAMSNGVREVWIHSSADLGASWQGKRYAAADNFAVPANLYFYATGKGTLRSKLSPLLVAPATAGTTHTITMARLECGDNPNPEPGAWDRGAKLARADFKTDLQVATIKVKDLDPKKYQIAHLTGTTAFTLNDEDLKALAAYLNGGGVLFADAAGGKGEFTVSFYALEKQLYPDSPPAPIPANHPLLQGNFPDGEAVGDPEFRKYAKLKIGGGRSVALDAVVVGGRTRIIYSPYDISSGLLGTQTWGIIGYAPDTAESLARNILLWSTNQGAAPAAAAAPAK